MLHPGIARAKSPCRLRHLFCSEAKSPSLGTALGPRTALPSQLLQRFVAQERLQGFRAADDLFHRRVLGGHLLYQRVPVSTCFFYQTLQQPTSLH